MNRSATLILWSPRVLGIPMGVGLAAWYAYIARDHRSWIVVIAGPLLIVGILHAISWLSHKRAR